MGLDEGGDVVDLVADDDPGVVGLVVLSDFGELEEPSAHGEAVSAGAWLLLCGGGNRLCEIKSKTKN